MLQKDAAAIRVENVYSGCYRLCLGYALDVQINAFCYQRSGLCLSARSAELAYRLDEDDVCWHVVLDILKTCCASMCSVSANGEGMSHTCVVGVHFHC